MSENPQQTNPGAGNGTGEKNGKYNLANIILIYGLSAVTLLGITAIIFSAIWGKKDDVFSSIKDILVLLLPVIGAWVGTVLAYYFSKENYKSAAETTKGLFTEFMTSEDKLRSTPVSKAMIQAENMLKLTLDKPEKDIKIEGDMIEQYLEKDKTKKYKRLPVLDSQGKPKYMIHRSLMDSFLVKATKAGKAREDQTLQDMLDDAEYAEVLKKSFVTIKPGKNLSDAKSLIDSVPDCQDVFVTETGEPTSAVLGWITNVIITKEAEIK